MKQIAIKNKELTAAISLMQKMELNRSDSRHRSKFVNILIEASKGWAEAEQELLRSYDALGENGKVKAEINADETLVAEILAEQQKLLDEEILIEGGMYTQNIDEIPRILNEYDGTLSGSDAAIYDRLLDEFEKNKEGK